jgi:hypothetical protein
MMCGSIAAMPSLSSAQAQEWETPAKWHRTLKKAEPGTLLLKADGVEFRSARLSRSWEYVDIRTFDLWQRKLILRPFRFRLSEPMPPEVAAQFSDRVGKPVRNGAPTTTAEAPSEIPGHHRTWSGGSNGTLRLKDTGVDYVTEEGRDSRTWRWADVQTIANPNPYELRITGYHEIAEFALKQPISRELLETMWDHLYGTGLNLSPSGAPSHQAAQEARR